MFYFYFMKIGEVYTLYIYKETYKINIPIPPQGVT